MMEEAAKKILFRELYQLDEDVSDEEDTSNASQILKDSKFPSTFSKDKAATNRAGRSQASRSNPPLKHTVSAPLISSSETHVSQNRPSVSQSFPATRHVRSPAKPSIDTPHGLCNPEHERAAPPMPTIRKRERGQSLEPRPEIQQIFKGLSFFFLPNDDIAPARKLRIRKAIEFGALWVREWRADITHLIVDKGLCYQDILSCLKVPHLPSSLVIVNEAYPPSCIRYHFGDFSVSSDPQHYRVEGHELATVAEHAPSQAESSTKSLKLKSDKAATLPSQRTTSRTESEEQQPFVPVLDDHTRPKVDPQADNALEDAIKEAKAIRFLPLDLDEEDKPDESHAMDDSDKEGIHNSRLHKKAKKGSSNKSWQDGFTCMSKHDGSGKSENPNARTIEVLQQMADYYERHQDHWRFTAYRKAIGALRKQSQKVTTARQAFGIPFIGERLADKIEEIVWTDRLRRLDNTNSEPLDEVFQLFMKIYGAGLKQATKWIDQGYRTLADLVAKASLTENQKVGIDHFDDFQSRIPREEMDRHDNYVRETCSKIDPSVQFTIGGSYRRGAASSGDVDFIITKPDCSSEVLRTIVMKTLIPQLFAKNYLKASLATSDEDSGSKWHGAAALPGEHVWRRIDFLMVPWQEMGAALIYFTGNDIFNRSIRLLASKKGMRLNQHGLWKDVIRGKNRERITQGTLVEGKDERKIFELLGVPWRPPHHRIC